MGDEVRMGPFGELAVAMRWHIVTPGAPRVTAGWLGPDVTVERASGDRIALPLEGLSVSAPFERWSRSCELPEPLPGWLEGRFDPERSTWWELPLRAGTVVELARVVPVRSGGYRDAPEPVGHAVLHLR